jgi:rod shape determining protein RodA
LGLIYIYSATYELPRGGIFVSKLVIQQAVWLVISLVIYHFVARMNLAARPATFWVLYVPIIALLSAVLFFGREQYGSTRWIPVGPFSFQPSELAKVMFVLLMAFLLHDARDRFTAARFLGTLAILGSFIIPILKQPDVGTALTFIVIYGFLLWFSEADMRFFRYFVAGVIVLSVPMWFILKDYQRERLIGFLTPSKYLSSTNYHVNQAKIAIGSGGLTGKGYLEGTQTQGKFIPNVYNDFIFAVVGEETGLLGAIIILTLYLLFILKIIYIARIAKTPYESLIAHGLAAMFLFQVLVNTGMNMGIMPVTGIPLPFLSYGGSSLITAFISLGIAQSIYRNYTRGFQLRP